MKQKKKPVIKDQYGMLVLVESIAAWCCSTNKIRVFLRSGANLDMSWASVKAASRVKELLEKQFDIL